jgi:hypothetical protein
MEAKLASMAKRSGSSESPMPEDVATPLSNGYESHHEEQDLDVEMGLSVERVKEESELGIVEGEKAAGELEREMQEEIGALSGSASASRESGRLGQDEQSGDGMGKGKGKERAGEMDLKVDHAAAALPPRPVVSYTPGSGSDSMSSRGVSTKEDQVARAREAAFRLGLASLPRKPML